MTTASGSRRRGGSATMRVTIAFLMLAAATGVEAFDRAALQMLQTEGGCPGCDLRDADLRAGEFDGGDFRKADLSGADLTEVVLVDAVLDGAKLRGADLTDAMLVNARMRGVDLSGATLVRTMLDGVDLTGAIGLTQAQLAETCDQGAGDRATVLPAGLALIPCD
ncbi:MAG: pentapeptide repeat-containing protein [Rhodospirillales bacterium]